MTTNERVRIILRHEDEPENHPAFVSEPLVDDPRYVKSLMGLIYPGQDWEVLAPRESEIGQCARCGETTLWSPSTRRFNHVQNNRAECP